MLMRAVILVLALLALHTHPARAEWRSAGQISNNAEARYRCPDVCGRVGWQGSWMLVEAGHDAVCMCKGRRSDNWRGNNWLAANPRGPRICVETDPIRNRLEAQMICPGACGAGTWDGSWHRMGPARATCGCSWRYPREFHPI
jgi:hypothetical protein